jgi:hypothetical protein
MTGRVAMARTASTAEGRAVGTGSPQRRRAVAAAVVLAATLAMTAIAVGGLATVTVDGRPIVVTATSIGLASGLGGAWFLVRGRIRLAGSLLVLSIVTPTYMAALINLVPLALGIVLLVDSFRAEGAFTDPPAQGS